MIACTMILCHFSMTSITDDAAGSVALLSDAVCVVTRRQRLAHTATAAAAGRATGGAAAKGPVDPARVTRWQQHQ